MEAQDELTVLITRIPVGVALFQSHSNKTCLLLEGSDELSAFF